MRNCETKLPQSVQTLSRRLSSANKKLERPNKFWFGVQYGPLCAGNISLALHPREHRRRRWWRERMRASAPPAKIGRATRSLSHRSRSFLAELQTHTRTHGAAPSAARYIELLLVLLNKCRSASPAGWLSKVSNCKQLTVPFFNSHPDVRCFNHFGVMCGAALCRWHSLHGRVNHLDAIGVVPNRCWNSPL
jgi:hypothetical protein